MVEEGINAYSADFSELDPDTTYVVYITGREEAGTIVGTSIHESSIIISRTSGTSVSCPEGFGLLDNGTIDLVSCSGHGRCVSGVCYCDVEFSGLSCDRVREIVLDRPDDRFVFIQGSMVLKGVVKESSDAIQTALRVFLSSTISIPLNQVQIRKWDFIYTEIASLARASSHVQRKHHSAQSSAIQIAVSFTLVVNRVEGTQKLAELSAILKKETALKQSETILALLEVGIESTRYV